LKLFKQNRIKPAVHSKIKNNILTFAAHPQTAIEKHVISIDLKTIK
jgi:hypothetical protein